MLSILSLWLPIVVAAIAVFVASSIVHMVLGYHTTDFQRLDQEDAVMAALRPLKIPPGEYGMPYCGSMKGMRDPAFKEKWKAGPVAFLTVLRGGNPGEGMGGMMAQWFVYCLVVSVFAAYLTGHAVQPGAPYLEVFRFAGCVGFIGYCLALVQISIWFQRPWSTTVKHLFDGVLYGLATGAVFGWLWPH